MSSASAIDAASDRWGPNDSTAHRMMFDAGARLELGVELCELTVRVRAGLYVGDVQRQRHVSSPALRRRTRTRRAPSRRDPSRRSRRRSPRSPPDRGRRRDPRGDSPIAFGPPDRSIQPRKSSPACRSAANRPTDPHDRLGRGLGGQAQRLLAEVDLLLADVAAEQHLVAGGRPAVGATLGSEEPDVGDVVLAARVGAAGDVGAHAADVGETGRLERLADRVGEPAGLRDGEVAGVGTGAGDDVAAQLGTGLGHADGLPAARTASAAAPR